MPEPRRRVDGVELNCTVIQLAVRSAEIELGAIGCQEEPESIVADSPFAVRRGEERVLTQVGDAGEGHSEDSSK